MVVYAKLIFIMAMVNYFMHKEKVAGYAIINLKQIYKF